MHYIINTVVILAALYIVLIIIGYLLSFVFCHYYSKKTTLLAQANKYVSSEIATENISKPHVIDKEQNVSHNQSSYVRIKNIIVNGFISGIIHYFCLKVGKIPSFAIRNYFYRHIFCMRITNRTIIYGGCEFRSPWNIYVGKSVIGANSILDGRGGISIADNVCLSSQVNIWSMQHDPQNKSFDVKTGTVFIRDYAWISSKATILPGRIINEGAVVANSAVVTKNCDAYGIYAGLPAKKIGERCDDLDYSLDTHWWFM